MPEVIKLIRDTDRFFQYETSSTPTTEDELQAYLKNTHAVVENLTDAYLWQPSTSYVLGQVIRSANMPAGTNARCTQAGTSDATEPAWSLNTNEFTDGSCKWKLVTIVNSISATGEVSGTGSVNDDGAIAISLALGNIVTAGTVGATNNQTARSFTIPYFHVNAKGRVTSYGTRTITISSAISDKLEHSASPDSVAISPSMGANFSTGQKITTFNVQNAKIAAGTHSIGSLLKALIKRAHSHKKVTIHGSDCNCNCNCNCDCGDDSSD